MDPVIAAATTTTLVPMITYMMVMSATPGPNNLMLLASGLNFGFRRSLPHLLGIEFGFALQIVLIGVGLGAVFDAFPLAHAVMRWVGLTYLLYLAWRIYTSGRSGDHEAGRPITFFEAALFQWVNPKAWIMAVSAVSLFIPDDQGILTGALLLSLIWALVGLPFLVLWAGSGMALRRLFDDPAWRQPINAALALLLVGTGIFFVI